MKLRKLGKTGYEVSEISLGTWQVGGGWGQDFDRVKAATIINKAIDCGVNFIDTADVYGDGLSENIVGEVYGRTNAFYIATKCGRKLKPHAAAGYNRENITRFVDDSLKNMKLECLDLIQLHCPPTDVYYQPEVFAVLDDLKKQGKIAHYGVSVERIEEALKAIEYPGLATVQIIFNMFRLRPAGLFFEQAKQKNIGVIVRVPLASGLLTGKLTPNSSFESGDHRSFNREGKFFDKGETFSGVDYEVGLEAVRRLKDLFPAMSLAQIALRWILMFDAVSCVIPGASRAEQVESNTAAAELPPLTNAQMREVEKIYDELIKPLVHYRW